MQDILISVAKIQADLGYGETVKVFIDGVLFTGIVAAVGRTHITVRLDDNRIICDYPLCKLAYHEV